MKNSANVAYLSLVIGMRLKNYICTQRRHTTKADAEDLTNLGVGALLHDIGKLGLEEVFHSVHAFDPTAQTEEYRSHADKGYKALQGRIEATAATIVLNHHQRFDGQGFPLPQPLHNQRKPVPLAGGHIHVFARIAALANMIDGLTMAAMRSEKPLAAALATLVQPALRGAFDPIVLDATLRSIPPFPLGVRVRLSDNTEAVVTDLNEAAPCKPVVQPIDRASVGAGRDGSEIDLSRPNAPTIAIDNGRPVTQFLYDLPQARTREEPAPQEPMLAEI